MQSDLQKKFAIWDNRENKFTVIFNDYNSAVDYIKNENKCIGTFFIFEIMA